jgi:hypothetical protein
MSLDGLPSRKRREFGAADFSLMDQVIHPPFIGVSFNQVTRHPSEGRGLVVPLPRLGRGGAQAPERGQSPYKVVFSDISF